MNLGSFQSFQGGLRWCSSIRAGGGPSCRSQGPWTQVSLTLLLQSRDVTPLELPPSPPLPSFLHVLHSDPFHLQESKRWGSYPTSERLFQNLLRIFPEEAEEEGQELEKHIPKCARRLLDLPSRFRLAGLPPPKKPALPKAPRPLAATSRGSVPGLVGAGEDRSLFGLSCLRTCLRPHGTFGRKIERGKARGP